MFSPFARFRKSRELKQAEILVNKGIQYLQGNLQHKALFQFQQAVDISPERVAEMLYTEFDKSYKRGDDELALSIGYIVLKIRKDDYELANKLGNSARKLKRYKEANDLYRQAFRINRDYELALYNLAASMGRLPKYNNDVKLLVEQFAHLTNYVLPHYKIDQRYIEKIMLIIKKEQQDASNSDDHKSAIEPTYNEICDRIRQKIKETSQQQPSSKQRQTLEGEVFNLGLFALTRKDSKLALKCFLQLKRRNSQLEYLDMVTTLAMDLESSSKKLVQEMMILLGSDKTNRYLNTNLGFMFKKQGKRILSYKYFATAALLLEKTGGIYCRMDLVQMADQEMELGNLKKALRLYQLVNSEIDLVHVKNAIGQILLYQSRYSEALPLYQEILEKDPKFKPAKQKLLEIHDFFLEKGEELFEIKKYTTALPYFLQALDAARLPKTVKRTADLYTQMMDNNKAEELYIEYNRLIKEQEKEDAEGARNAYIKEGRAYLEQKDYQHAIESFEKAFELKADKDVFVFLAHIFKIQKRTKDLQQLLLRWKERINKDGINLNDL